MSALEFTFGDSRTMTAPRDGATVLKANLSQATGDGAKAVREALSAPLGFPPLASAVTPGDHVAIALEGGIPQAPEIVAGVVTELLLAGVEPADISVVTLEGESMELQIAELAGERPEFGSILSEVNFTTHDPDDETELAMVGVTVAGLPLRINRTLIDADVILPIRVARATGNGRPDGGKFAGLFPEFSDRETRERLRLQSRQSPPNPRGVGTRKPAATKSKTDLAVETDEAGWLIGVQLTVCAVPAGAGRLAAVIAGDPNAVADAASRMYTNIWRREVDAVRKLAVAALGGPRREQTWDNLGLALLAAEEVLAPGGAIALCTELAERPGRAVSRLRNSIDYGAAEEAARRDSSPDAAVAAVLARALARGPVYLQSQLPRDVVEAIGMTPLLDGAELSRLAATRGGAIVIEEAQRMMPRVEGKANGSQWS